MINAEMEVITMKKKLISLFVLLTLSLGAVPVFSADTKTDNKAEIVMKAFGIGIVGESSEYITKGEFARAILKACGQNSELTDEEAVQTIVKEGLYPAEQAQSVNAYVPVETAAETITKLLGYSKVVEQKGAMATAIWLKLFTGVSANANNPLTVSDCYRLLYNMLEVNCFSDDSYSYNQATGEVEVTSSINTTETALSVLFDGFKIRTEVLADEYASVNGYTSYKIENKIYTRHGFVDVKNCQVNGYVGKTIEIYGRHVDGEMVALCFFSGNWDDTLIIPMEDIKLVKGFNAIDDYSSRSNPYIVYKGKNKAYFSNRFTILYNGFPASNIKNEDFSGEYGNVELIDTDSDKRYDIANISDGIYLEVSNVDMINERIVFKNPYVYISTEHEDVVIYSHGRQISLENVEEGSFVEIKTKKLNDMSELTEIENAQIHVLSEISQGSVTALDAEGKIIEIDGTAYKATSAAVAAVNAGGIYDFAISNDLIVVNAKRSQQSLPYAYFVGYYTKNSLSKDVEIAFYNMAREYKTCFLTDRTIFTGYDKNGVWQTRKKYNRKKMAEILDANFPDNKRALLCISVADNGDVTFVMPRNMETETDYCGFNDEEFSLEHEIQLSEKSQIASFGVLTDSYRARSKTKVIVDDINDIDGLRILNYGADYSSVAGPSKFMQKGYIYDTDEDLFASIIVLQCDFTTSQNSNWQDLLKGQPLVIEKVRGAILPDGDDGYRIDGYRSGSYTKIYTKGDATSDNYTTPFTAYTNKTKVSQLRAGDIIIPVIDNFTGHAVGFIPILTPDSNGDSEEYACSYWGGSWDNTGSFNAAFSYLTKNYNNKTFKLDITGEKLFAMPLTVYVFDTSSGELTKEDAGTYLYDNAFSERDKVFISASKYDVRFIVVYRR